MTPVRLACLFLPLVTATALVAATADKAATPAASGKADASDLTALRAKAERGNAIAQYNLGLAYLQGRQTPVDPIEAYVWLTLAADGGSTGKALEGLRDQLSAAQTAEATRRLESLRASNQYLRANATAAKAPTITLTPAPRPTMVPAPQIPVQPAGDANEVTALRNALQAAQADVAKQANEAAVRRAEASAARAETETLRQQLKDTRDEYAHRARIEAAARANTVTAEVAAAQRQIDTLTAQLLAAEAAAKSAAAHPQTAAQSETKLTAAQQQIAALEQKLQAAQAEQARVANESAAQLRSRDEAVRALTAEKAMLTTWIAGLEKTLQESTAREQETGALQTRLADLMRERDAAKQEALAAADRAKSAGATAEAVQKLETEKRRLESELAAAATEKQRLTGAQATAGTEIEKLRIALAASETARAESNRQSASAEEATRALRQRADALTAAEQRLAGLAAENTRLAQRAGELERAAKAASEQARAESTRQSSTTQETASALRQRTEALATAEQRVSSLTTENATLAKRVSELERTAKTASEQARSLVPATELETARRAATEAQEKLAGATKEIEGLREQARARRDLETRVRQLEGDNTKLTTRLTEIQSRKSETPAAPVAAKSDADPRLAAALQANEAITKERDELTARTNELTAKLAAQTDALAKAETRANSSLAALATSAASNTEIETLRTRAATAEQTTEQLRSELARAQEILAARSSPRRPTAPPTSSSSASHAVAPAPQTPTPATAAAPAPVVGAPRVHTISAGDTLSSISRQYYGTPNRWQDILAANRDVLRDERSLVAGRTLRIP